MRRIELHQPRVPWSWIGGMTLPWLALFYMDNTTGGGPLTFTIRKFSDDPVLIGLLGSIHVVFGFTVGVVASYMSDRIWTRWGRRRPFLIAGWTGAAAALALLPLARDVWALGAMIVVLQFCAQIAAKPVEPLVNEVVPPAQRGRAASVRTVAQQVMTLLFFGVLVAQFDSKHVLTIAGRVLTFGGERTLYWAGSAFLLGIVLFLAFGVRETRAPEQAAGKTRFVVREFLRDVFGHRQWWLVYLLYITPLLGGPGGGFGMLMQTEQLGFSKAQVGFAVSFGTIVTALLIAPGAGYLVDWLPRLRLLRIGLIVPALIEFGFFLFLRYAAGYSIGLGTLIAFTTAAGALKMLMFLVWGPLVFDYIPRDRFGTVGAGLTFVAGLVTFVVTNLAGWWITGFTRWFGSVGRSHNDYSSLYVLQLALCLVGLAITFYFERQERAGRVAPLGRMEIAGGTA